MTEVSRRFFIFLTGLIATALGLFGLRALLGKCADKTNSSSEDIPNMTNSNLGADINKKSYVYVVKNGSAEANTRKLIEMMGGISSLIDPTDVVLLKPNAQWWNQGTTNTDSMKAFIEMVLQLPDFTGEIIIGENHHFPENNSRGWTTEKRNGSYNLNELVEYFQERGHKNVTKYHWHDGGPTTEGMWGGATNGGIVGGPEDGEGYVWRNDSVFTAPSGRKALMSYPIFTSQYSGITIDFCNGLWKKGKHLPNKLKFINFSALNNHGSAIGVTASIKNYLGVCDMTCGFRGTIPKGYYNFHFIGLNNLHWRIKELLIKIGWREQYSAIGGCVGHFMKYVRMADMNIITAEWVGYGSRTDKDLRSHTRTVLASIDPVALDYIAAKNILLPETIKKSKDRNLVKYHDPDRPDSPFRMFLLSCHNQGIGNLETGKIQLQSYDFSKNSIG